MSDMEHQRTYLFLVRQSGGSPWRVDSWYDISEPLALGTLEIAAGVGATSKNVNEVTRAYRNMDMRARYNSDMKGPLIVKTDFDLKQEDLERYLNIVLRSDKERKQFFIKARASAPFD